MDKNGKFITINSKTNSLFLILENFFKAKLYPPSSRVLGTTEDKVKILYFLYDFFISFSCFVRVGCSGKFVANPQIMRSKPIIKLNPSMEKSQTKIYVTFSISHTKSNGILEPVFSSESNFYASKIWFVQIDIYC